MPGADADITIYTPHENKETMFEMPRMVIKSGRVIVEAGRNPRHADRQDAARQPDYDREVEPDIQRLVRKVLLDPLAKLSGRSQLSARIVVIPTK